MVNLMIRKEVAMEIASWVNKHNEIRAELNDHVSTCSTGDLIVSGTSKTAILNSQTRRLARVIIAERLWM